MFTHINEYLNRVGYLFTYFLFLSVRTMLNYIYTTVSCVYIYVYTNASSASRPPTGRTIHTSPSLALTNGSTFGELLLLPCFVFYLRRYFSTQFIRRYPASNNKNSPKVESIVCVSDRVVREFVLWLVGIAPRYVCMCVSCVCIFIKVL